MGNFPGKRYQPQPSDGISPPARWLGGDYIDHLSYVDACRQYNKDVAEDRNLDTEKQSNFVVGTLPLGGWAAFMPTLSEGVAKLFGVGLGLLGASTTLVPGDSNPQVHESCTGLGFSEIKGSWDTLVDHFGPGVVELPKDIPDDILNLGLDVSLRGGYQDPFDILPSA